VTFATFGQAKVEALILCLCLCLSSFVFVLHILKTGFPIQALTLKMAGFEQYRINVGA
jgi:hypothetical protein